MLDRIVPWLFLLLIALGVLTVAEQLSTALYTILF